MMSCADAISGCKTFCGMDTDPVVTDGTVMDGTVTQTPEECEAVCDTSYESYSDSDCTTNFGFPCQQLIDNCKSLCTSCEDMCATTYAGQPQSLMDTCLTSCDMGGLRRLSEGPMAEIDTMVTAVVNSLTTCPASEAVAADPPKPNAVRFVVTAAKKEDVDLGAYKKNLAAQLGVTEDKLAVVERIKHKVKATYKLSQTMDEFEASGMRAKIKTKVATAAGVTEDAVAVEAQVADLSGRRRLAEGVTVKTTVTTDNKATADSAKAAMPKTKAAASDLFEVEVAEEPEAPSQEEVTELETIIIAETPTDEANIDGVLTTLAASVEAASTALGLEVADASNEGFVAADEISPLPPSPPPVAPPPAPQPAIPSAIEDAVRAALALPVGAIIGIAVGGFFVVVVCPITIAIICCCCMKGGGRGGKQDVGNVV